MKHEDYFVYTGTLFIVVALLHATRVYNDWAMTLGPWDVPMWLSWGAVILTGFFAYSAFQLKK